MIAIFRGRAYVRVGPHEFMDYDLFKWVYNDGHYETDATTILQFDENDPALDWVQPYPGTSLGLVWKELHD
jgi:hypothetical protein